MSSPPFQMEDQTDADFFDKLVDDDFGDSVSGPSFLPGIESDDVQAFSNLTMNEVGTVSEDFGGEEEDQSKDVIVASVGAPEKDILVSEESVSLVTSNSVPVESNNAVTVPSVLSESATSGGFGSKGISIKEVQWNLFNADSTQNGEGSYSEFFTGVGDSAGDPFSSYDDNLKADPFANMGNNLNADPFANLGNNVKADPFANSGNNVKADRFTDVGDKLKAGFDPTSGVTENVVSESTASSISAQHQDSQVYGASNEQTTSGQESYDTQYWENLYPGWRYDPNTGQWLQVEGFDATANAQVSYGEATQETGHDLVLGQKSEISYLQQSAQSVVETVAEGCTTGSVSTWNQAPQGITEYPAHMVFDPQYPGWYYDTITQEWRTLESYVPATQSTSTSHSQQVHSWNNSNGGFSSDEHSLYGDGQVTSYSSQNLSGQNQAGNWAGSAGNYSQQNMNMWQPETLAKSDALGSTVNRNLERIYGSRDHLENMQDQHRDFQPMGNSFMYEQASQNHSSNDVTGFQSFVPSDNSSQHFNQPMLEQSQQKRSSHDLYGSHNSTFYSPQMFQTGTQTSSKLNEGRSSAGRPPHALVTFGFGGKLIVVRDHSSYASSSAFGNQESVGGSISVLNLMDVVADKNDSTQIGLGVSDYFNTLSQQSYPGPLVGGSVGAKEVSKWIDERIAKCESPYMDYRRGQLLRLLLSLLKIASQNYGKLRSPFGTDPSLKGSDRPEIAVAELFASSSKNDAQMRGYGTSRCLQNAPSEAQQEVTAAEVQNLLVYGKRLEALQCAQEGQLWGIAMQLARDLGEQFYADTEKQMAHRMLVAGSPLKTLSLLLAGQPADVFSVDNNTSSGLPGAVNMSQHHAQIGPNGMLDDWERNLAAVTSIRTKGDELVILHLGDCLWKERGENIAAHMCYLLAEANFESFSDGARLCLIGADHWKFPRTYASPEAIQRTEFYEYSMVLGNSQSVLLPFQPYKLIYAYMLAEMGRLSDSLKYCQAISKSLKTSRQPEVDVWKQLLLSLEDRIKAHQQSGFATNLAPRKLVGKFLPFIDSTIHRMMGPPPTPGPSGNANEHDGHPAIPRVANSQSTMAMQSLVPSASMEPISAWGSGGGRSMPNRSISEPDFGRSPRQEASSSDPQGKASDAGGPSRFGRFGSSFIQKTMGWVSKSRSDRQAKLGEKNKFYYDEKLKRWVEEGAEPPAEQIAPPPPPTSATFQNGMPDYNIKNAFKGDSSPANGGAEHRSPPSSERSSGIPPIPPSSNQFSARGRMGVRSRYVDTFNKGGGATTSFSAPSVAAPKPGGGAAKFFVPTPTSSSEQMADTTSESKQDNAATIQDEPTFMSKDSFLSPPPPSSSSMQRFPSMNNITPTGNKGMGSVDNGNGSLSSRSRRTASWSGSFSGAMNPPKGNEVRPLGEALGMSPLSSMQSNPSTAMHMSTNGGNFGDDLHEVEL